MMVIHQNDVKTFANKFLILAPFVGKQKEEKFFFVSSTHENHFFFSDRRVGAECGVSKTSLIYENCGT